jgi:hypothetical protein
MPTWMQVVERLRERGHAPVSGPVSVQSVARALQPTPRGSVRALMAKALEGAVRRRWAIILCRYKGEMPNPALEQPVEQFYRRAFTPGTGGMLEYWRDASLGAIDVSGSTVFGWVNLEIPLSQGGTGAGTTRGTTVDYAVNACRRDNLDPTTGFYGQIAVITRNWTVPNVPAGSPDWGNPNDPLKPWYPFWIDGSAIGTKTTLTPPHNGNIMAHEMGHGLSMQHDVGADLTTEYADPCCIMSQNNAFMPPGWAEAFGPALCLPHLVQRGWMFSRRLYTDDGSWMTRPAGVTLPLAPLTDPGAHANLGLKLPYRGPDGSEWDYYVEYVKPTGWNQGLLQPYVFIRRIASVAGSETPIYLGLIPATPGVPGSFLEPRGNVLFQVEWFDANGRIAKITAQK